jgi:hypothetical protein
MDNQRAIVGRVVTRLALSSDDDRLVQVGQMLDAADAKGRDLIGMEVELAGELLSELEAADREGEHKKKSKKKHD